MQTAIEACASQLPPGHTQFEDTALLVSSLFVQYATDDARLNKTALELMFAKFFWDKEPTPADVLAATNFAGSELQETFAMLEEALDLCRAVANNTIARPKPRPLQQLNMPGLQVGETGYFVSTTDGRPYFPFGYVWGPTSPAANESNISGVKNLGLIGATITSEFVTPSHVDEEFNVSPVFIDSLRAEVASHEQNGMVFSVLLGHGSATSRFQKGDQVMPSWATDKYPGLLDSPGITHFCSYDIDNPGARVIWNATLAAVVPILAASPSHITWNLHNEPGWSSANSTHTFSKFSQYLKKIYNNDTELMSKAWNYTKSFSSFSDPTIAQGMGSLYFSQLQQVDWSTFNQQRVLDFWTFLCDTIKMHSPASKRHSTTCQVKTINAEAPLGFSHDIGINRVALAQKFGAVGCDSRSEYWGDGVRSSPRDSRTPKIAFPQFPGSLYALDFVTMCGTYDFMSTVSPPGTLVMDTEWHPFRQEQWGHPHIPRKYVSAVSWMAVLHGLHGAITWVWEREGWTSKWKSFSDDVLMTIVTEPQLMESYANVPREMNSISEIFVTLATAAPKIWILYSETSAIVNRAYLETQLAVYSLAHFVGAQIGFVPDTDFATAPPENITGVLLIPAVSHISDATLNSLQRMVNSSSLSLVAVANSTTRESIFLHNERGDHSRSPNEIDWARYGLPYVDIGGSEAANEITFMSLLEMMPLVSLGIDVRCVSTDQYLADGTRPVAFGVMCRSAPVTDIYHHEVTGVTHAIAVLNMLNSTATIAIESSGELVTDGYNPLIQRNVAGLHHLVLAPLDHFVFLV